MDSEEITEWDKESERAWLNDPHTSGFPNEVVDLLCRCLPLESLILDAGCGIGKHIAGFTQLGYRCSGIDQSKMAVKHARQTNPKSNIQLMRIQELRDKDKYDMIFTSAVLQHSLHKRKKTILKIFHTALKPKGLYLCTENTLTPKNIGGHYIKKEGKFLPLTYKEDVTDGYSFTHQGWLKFMAENRFNHITTIFPYPYYLFKVSKKV